MEYYPIRAHGSSEFWERVKLLAELQKTSLGALVLRSVEIANAEQLALLERHAASNVVNSLHELHAEADNA